LARFHDPWCLVHRGCTKTFREKTTTLRGTDGSMETGLMKLIPGRWNGAPREVPRRTSETRRMSSLRGMGGNLKAPARSSWIGPSMQGRAGRPDQHRP
jgi:hypothetical protein